MKEFKYVIKDEQGIHARPAGMFVKEAAAFSSKVTISKDGKEVDDADEDHQYQALRDEYANAEIINFTVVQ